LRARLGRPGLHLSDNLNYGAIKVLPEAVGLFDVLGRGIARAL
jgi:hypothetical protein